MLVPRMWASTALEHSLSMTLSVGAYPRVLGREDVEACCASDDANQCPGRYMGGKKGGKQNLGSLLVTYY